MGNSNRSLVKIQLGGDRETESEPFDPSDPFAAFRLPDLEYDRRGESESTDEATEESPSTLRQGLRWFLRWSALGAVAAAGYKLYRWWSSPETSVGATVSNALPSPSIPSVPSGRGVASLVGFVVLVVSSVAIRRLHLADDPEPWDPERNQGLLNEVSKILN